MGTADWGTATLGRLVLREGFTLTSALNGQTGFRTLTLTGEESTPPLTLAEMKRRQEDIVGLQGRLVPVTFTHKSDHNGWYTIQDVDTNLTNWTGEAAKFSWTLQAVRIGAELSVDLESRAASVVRSNNFALAGERWHAPAGGALGYYTGTTPPSGTASRAIADGGTLTVYRGVPAAVSPRWACSLAGYQLGRSRILVDAVERVAEDVAVGTTNWELNNGLVKVTPGVSASFQISSWDGAWETVDWNASITSATSGTITTWEAASIIRNDYEMVTLRLLESRAPGRATLDLSLRRGSRFVETYLQTDTSTTLGWYRAATEAGTAGTGYVSATANDAAGNRYIIGSAKTFTNNLNGGLSLASTRTLDAFIGSVVGGASAAAGDVATVVRDQYILVLTETTMGAPR